MIIKFDHISFSCQIDAEQECIKQFQGYEENFHERNLENLLIKKGLLSHPSSVHNITLLSRKENYPIEITAYPVCTLQGIKYEIVDDEIVVYTGDADKTKKYFLDVGFEIKEDGAMYLKPMLDRMPVKLRIRQGTEVTPQWSLDNVGYGSLAFVVDNTAKQKRLLEEKGIKTTEVQELCVNGRNLKIFFSVSDTGEIVEYISLGK